MSNVPVFNTPVILSLGIIYLLVVIGIGVWSYFRTRSAADFFVAGQTLSIWVLTMAIFASVQSGFGFIGVPGMYYRFGMSFFWAIASMAIAFPLAWFFLAKRMRLLAEVRNILTLPDAVAVRYKSRGAQFWMAIAVLLGVLGYLGSQVQALGVIMQAVFGVDLVVGALIGLAILAFYTFIGGILAGVYTDFFQGVIMLIAAIFIFVWSLSVGGGIANIAQNIALANPKLIGPVGVLPVMAAFSWYFIFSIGVAGQPHMSTKLYMIKNPLQLKWGGFLTALAYVISNFLAIGVGFTMLSLVSAGKRAAVASPDLVVPTFLMDYCPEVLTGIVLAGILAATMSTGNSFLNIGAAALVRDIPRSLGVKVQNELFWGRLATLALVIISTLFALYMKTLVALLGTFGFTTFAAAIVPVVAIGLNWKRGTPAAAITAPIVGLAAGFAFQLLAKYNLYKIPSGADSGAIAMMLAIVVYLAISMIQKRRDDESGLDPDIKVVLDA